MRKPNPFPFLVFFVILAAGVAFAYARYGTSATSESLWTLAASVVIAFIAAAATKIADQWDRAVVLRLGHFHSLKGPGLFFIIPVLDAIPYWIDTRVITTCFKAEKTLTKDTVPVDVDAVLFWKVVDPKKAALDVADYPKRHQLGLANRPARRDRQDHAFGYAGRQGQNQQPAAEDH